MILDEAQQIKNSKSQTWQVLAGFQTECRLLQTGTPLQNDLTELWSYLNFQQPEKFESRDDFKEWFREPLQKALLHNKAINWKIIDNQHSILRPMLLRRLKKDVEKQLPSKKEVIVKCPLSLRQKYQYDEFISHDFRRSSTHNNDFINQMNLQMQLRKTCNHPNLVEEKQVKSAFIFPRLNLVVPKRLFLDGNGVNLPQACYIGLSDDKNATKNFSQVDLNRQLKWKPTKNRINNMMMINHKRKEKELNFINWSYEYTKFIDHEINVQNNYLRNDLNLNLIHLTLCHALINLVKIRIKKGSIFNCSYLNCQADNQNLSEKKQKILINEVKEKIGIGNEIYFNYEEQKQHLPQNELKDNININTFENLKTKSSEESLYQNTSQLITVTGLPTNYNNEINNHHKQKQENYYFNNSDDKLECTEDFDDLDDNSSNNFFSNNDIELHQPILTNIQKLLNKKETPNIEEELGEKLLQNFMLFKDKEDQVSWLFENYDEFLFLTNKISAQPPKLTKTPFTYSDIVSFFLN